MADVWNVDVARIDTQGNLYLNGGISYNADSVVLVQASSTDIGRYSNLQDAYASAKTLKPGGNELSSKNRAAIILPSGVYDSESNSLLLDTDYVDIIAQSPEVITKTHIDYSKTHTGLTELGWLTVDFPLPRTRLLGSPASGRSVVEQSVEDVRLIGFSIECYYDGTGVDEKEFGFYCDAPEGGKYSYYEKMTFYSDIWDGVGSKYYNLPTNHKYHFDGEWVDCVGCDYSFRLSNENDLGTPVPNSQEWRAVMRNCHAGSYSFAGDSLSGIIKGAYVEACTSAGASFGGCSYHACASDADTKYIECKAIPYGNSFSLGHECEASLIRCSGGPLCGGATASTSKPGIFSGYAEDCRFGKGSLGGRGDAGLGIPADGTNYYMSGTVVGCIVTGTEKNHYLKGASIRNSIFVSDVTKDCFRLLDGESEIFKSILGVDSDDTGTIVESDSSNNVVFLSNIINNIDQNSTGLGSNVTNISGSKSWGLV